MKFLGELEGPREAHIGDDAVGARGELVEQFFRWFIKETGCSVELG